MEDNLFYFKTNCEINIIFTMADSDKMVPYGDLCLIYTHFVKENLIERSF